MYSIFAWNVLNCVGFWGSAPDPAGGAYNAPPDPLVGSGFSPSICPTAWNPLKYALSFTANLMTYRMVRIREQNGKLIEQFTRQR